MSSNLSASRDALLGALVGLARALSTNAALDTTPSVMISALLAASDSASPETLAEQTALVRAEKFRVSPSCASCPCPCGATEDYDLALLRSAPEDVRAVKRLLLAALYALSRAASADDASAFRALCDGLFLLADERPAEALCPLVLRLGLSLDALS